MKLLSFGVVNTVGSAISSAISGISGISGISAIIIGGMIFTSVQAAENDLLTDAESQKKYERKVLLQITDLGVKKRDAKFLVFFCPKPKKDEAKKKVANALLGNLSGNCIPVGTWKFKISQSLEDRAAAELLGRLSGSRYDILQIKPGKLSLKTLFETIEADIGAESPIKKFSFDTGKFSAFKKSVGEYLNANIAPLMIDLLAKAKDARYQEMQDKERETFLATTAKEVSVPVKFIERLMNSAFVFAAHTETPTGSVTISESTRNRKLQYSTNVSVNLKSNLAMFRFNASSGKFEFYKRISESSGKVSASNKVYLFRPMSADVIVEPFENSFVVAAKAAGIASNITLKSDDNFAIFSTVDEINGNDFSSAIGENEDLRIDSPYKVYQYVDGKKTETGWGKVRSVASTKSFKENNAEYKSDFDLIRGDAEIKDQLREHPWSGVFFYADAGQMTLNIDSIDNQDHDGGGAFSGMHLGIKTDLGYMFNSSSFSEVWLELFVGVGAGGDDIGLTGSTATWTDPTMTSGGLDLTFRYHLGSSGIYTGYKFGLGAAQIDATGVGLNEDIKISSGLSLGWGLQAGYVLSPNTDLFINVQGLVPLGGEADINGTTLDTELSGGVDVNIGFSTHLKSIGGLARIMN